MESATNPAQHPKATFLFGKQMAIDLFAIAILWALSAVLVNPIGDFPLNDDWAMGKTVKTLVEQGNYHPSGWTGMPLITQTLWGALFCLPKGFSFTALRFSTLVLSFIGAAAFYALVRQLGKSRLFAALCAATLAWNPIYFALSNSFMTDVPFTTLLIFASFFYARYFEREADRDLLLATAFALAAVLCRQLGLCIPLGFGAALLLKYRFNRRCLFRALAPTLLSIIVLVAFQYWLSSTGRLPALYNEKSHKLISVVGHPLKLFLNIFYYGWSILMYLGWFLFPVCVALASWFPAKQPRLSRLNRAALLLFAVASVARFIIVPSLMPVHNNVIIPQGIGPATLKDTQNLHLPHLPPLPVAFWVFVTVISWLGAALLILNTTPFLPQLFRRIRPVSISTPDRPPIAAFFLLSTLFYLIPLLMTGFFDRYLIPVLPLLAAFVIASQTATEYRWTRIYSGVAAAFVIIFGLFAIIATRDYLEWNRIRWLAARNLLASQHVSPHKVDGGFEFNGWYSYETFTMTNWWVINDSYALAFGEIKGYEPLTQYHYKNWAPHRTGAIFVLRKSEHTLPPEQKSSPPSPDKP